LIIDADFSLIFTMPMPPDITFVFRHAICFAIRRRHSSITADVFA
jgi:hypothetical protein